MRRRLNAVTAAVTPAIRRVEHPSHLRTCGRGQPAVTDPRRHQLLSDQWVKWKIRLPWLHSGLPPFSVPTIWLTSWLFSTQKYSMISVFTIKGECPNSVNGLVYAPGSSMVTSNSRCPESG